MTACERRNPTVLWARIAELANGVLRNRLVPQYGGWNSVVFMTFCVFRNMHATATLRIVLPPGSGCGNISWSSELRFVAYSGYRGPERLAEKGPNMRTSGKIVLAAAAISLAAVGTPNAAMASILQNCRNSMEEYFVCTVIDAGVSRVAKMTVDQLEDMLRQHYSNAPTPGPLIAARCSVACGQIANSPPELKPYAIEQFFSYNCPAAGFSLNGSICVRH